jgi:hypothetical protein
MYSAVTKLSRQRRMKDFYNLDGSKYILIGRTSPWTNELIPPQPTGDETSLDELIGGKLVQAQWYVKMLTDPTNEEKTTGVYYKGHYYFRTTDPAVAVTKGCTDVMLYVGLDRDELPLETFRQVGVQTQVQHSASTITADQFNSITEKGNLEIIENRKPQTRADDQMETIYIIINF